MRQNRCCWSNWNCFGLMTLAVSCRPLRNIFWLRLYFSSSLVPPCTVCTCVYRGGMGSCDILCYNWVFWLPDSLTLPLHLLLSRLLDNNSNFIKAKLKLLLNASCCGTFVSPFPAHLCFHSPLVFLMYFLTNCWPQCPSLLLGQLKYNLMLLFLGIFIPT